MKIRKQNSNSLIQLTVLAQQIIYNGHAMTLLENLNLTLKGGGNKKEDLHGSQTVLLFGMGITRTKN